MMHSNGVETSPRFADPPGVVAPILLAEDLRKSYGNRPALRGLSFELQAGHILGFLGPNGAGKTTAIRILTTILQPTSGYFLIDGITSDYPEQIRQKIGVLPESLGFPKQATALEYLVFFGQLYGCSAADAKRASLTLLEEVGLQDRARSLLGSYSRGMRQRLGIARALINDPVVVFLDEPTLGLDPRGQQELLGLVRRIARERNAAVVLCSHLLWEVEDVCDEVVILQAGQIIAQGSVSDVTGRAQRNIVRVRMPAAAIATAQHAAAALPMVMQATPTGKQGDWLMVQLADQADASAPNEILHALLRADVPILHFDAEGGRLQDVFLQLTEGATP